MKKRDYLRAIVARGYCHPLNSGKALDSDLLEAIVDELMLATPEPLCPCTASDAWKCAWKRGLTGQIACTCACHKPSTPAPASAEPSDGKFRDVFCKNCEHWRQFHVGGTCEMDGCHCKKFVPISVDDAKPSTPAVADALQLISAERERQVEPECKRCHQTMLIRDGEEPTEVCDHCAHEMLSAISDVVLHYLPAQGEK